MTQFADALDRVWHVSFDGIILGELKQVGVDLGDDGLYKIEHDEALLVQALAVVCREQLEASKITAREFARAITGEVFDRAIEAVRGAAAAFFRKSRWSEILSSLQRAEEAAEVYDNIKPMLSLLNKTDMPEAFRQAVMDALSEKIQESAPTDSQTLPVDLSVFGLENVQPSPVSSGPDSAELTREG